ncbi:predicted protein [Botrytis cinerea T4]|uniref:Uncharacterized protein n=1 Tax=Botryotinia fuckeliana (strain T4) TaxID=999810 RepID=G2Y837_BOTF4|nr:predicted protein [Botrytis cinerea T4]
MVVNQLELSVYTAQYDIFMFQSFFHAMPGSDWRFFSPRIPLRKMCVRLSLAGCLTGRQDDFTWAGIKRF